MFIKSLEIKDNTRLMIRGTTHLKINFDEIYQLILGTNGCGKSTIMQELSPLPANGQDYIKNGYKIIIVEHNNKLYQLSSHFPKTAGDHSFIDLSTGEELNPGGTKTVQSTLVKEQFGYDQELHDVLTDQIKFTNMSPLNRRDWLTRMSGTNLDFAIELFNKLKRVTRDEDAVLKHLTTRLNKESADLLSQDAINEMQTELKRLDDHIKLLYTHRINENISDPDTNLSRLEKHIKDIKNKTYEFLRLPFDRIFDDINSFDDFKARGKLLEFEITNAKKNIETYQAEHNEIKNILVDISEQSDIDSIKQQLTDYHQQVDIGFEQLRMLDKSVQNAQELFGIAKGIVQPLTEIVTQMPDNTEGLFTREKREQAMQQYEALSNRLTFLKQKMDHLHYHLDGIKNMQSTECPKCHHVFKAGVDESTVPNMEKDLAAMSAEYTNKDTERNNVSAYLDDMNRYIELNKQYRNTIRNNPTLQMIWDHINKVDLTKQPPKVIVSLFTTALDDLRILSSIERLMPEIYRLEATLDKINSATTGGKYTEERLIKLETMIRGAQDTINTNAALSSKMRQSYEQYKKLQDAHSVLMRMFNEARELAETVIKSYKKAAIENDITQTNGKIARVGYDYQEAQNKQNIINDVIRSRDISAEKNDLFKLILNEINPTNGLIADMFKQFINQFVEQVNIIINKVWEHPIEVLPCGIDDSGLTYKFPLRVNNKPYGPPDGSKGSNSQVTIVNFAFKIVVMIYLGLESYPLYLDELAPDLDEKHRINIINFVRSFVESKRCSQMFMVSHYETGYGGFTNAQILILDSENLLELPNSYNEHAYIVKDYDIAEEADVG